MSNPLSFEELKPDLISLGFAFYGESSPVPPDPERALLRVIELCPTERKTFVMLLAWLEKARERVHVERLKGLSEELSIPALPIFGALCLKQVHQGDRRFSTLVNAVRARAQGQSLSLGASFALDPYMVSKYGTDQEFLEFGIHTARVDATDEKKILTLEGILANNPWLRIRALMGANFRADIAYLMTYKRASNANQVFRMLGCNLETAYRLWKALAQVPGIDKLAS